MDSRFFFWLHNPAENPGAENQNRNSDKMHQHVGNEFLGQGKHRSLAHKAAGIQHGAEGGRHQAQAHHDGVAHPEMDRVDAKGLGNRYKDGGGNNNDGGAIQEHAHNEDNEHDQAEHGVCTQVQPAHQLHQVMGQADILEHPAEQLRGAEDDHDAGGILDRVLENAGQVGKLDVPVDKQPHNQGVQHSQHSRFSGSADAGEDPAQNNDGSAQGPDAVPHGAQAIGDGLLFGSEFHALIALHPAQEIGGKAKHHSQEQAGWETGAKDGNDGAVAHKFTVENQADAGRNDGSQHRTSGNAGGGEGTAVAFLEHGGNQNSAQSHGAGNCRAGDRCKEGAGEDTHEGQAAAELAHQHLTQFDKAGSNAAFGHQVACQDKERHAEQRGRIDTGQEAAQNDMPGNAVGEHDKQG